MSAPAAPLALRFFDPQFAELRDGVELVQLLVAGRAPDSAIRIDSGEATKLVERLMYHRLLPQLADGLARGTVRSEVLEAEVGGLTTWLAMSVLELERTLVEVGEAFDRADLEFLVLKGVATGRLDHPDAAARQAADVDILVHVDDADRAGTVLAAAGFARPQAVATLMDKGGSWSRPRCSSQRRPSSRSSPRRASTAGATTRCWRGSSTCSAPS